MNEWSKEYKIYPSDISLDLLDQYGLSYKFGACRKDVNLGYPYVYFPFMQPVVLDHDDTDDRYANSFRYKDAFEYGKRDGNRTQVAYCKIWYAQHELDRISDILEERTGYKVRIFRSLTSCEFGGYKYYTLLENEYNDFEKQFDLKKDFNFFEKKKCIEIFGG